MNVPWRLTFLWSRVAVRAIRVRFGSDVDMCSALALAPPLPSSGFLRSWFPDLPHKISLHGRPLGCNNAVDASVPECAVLSDLMATQYTIQFCAQPLYAMTTLVVEKMSPKLNGDTMQCFKCMLEK